MGLLVLRVKEPNLERPYKTWIITPLTFSAVRSTISSARTATAPDFLKRFSLLLKVALFLLSMPIAAAPLEALAAVGAHFRLDALPAQPSR